ncbi:MAG: hypothetical protein ABII18_13740 [bacterium]|nr:hypothetical protein [bacterium]MBU1918714.1 hypothetical protein [bacterium]
MLKVDQIKKLFKDLNAELVKQDVIGEIGICGGAVMCLVYQARNATKDVDGIFEPTKEIRLAAKKVAQAHGLDADWINDAAKSFFHVDPPKEEVMQLSNLRVWAPTAKYMLAMKAVSARFDSHDKDDLVFLIEYLSLKSSTEVFDVISQYYPKNKIPAKTQFLVEELFGE